MEIISYQEAEFIHLEDEKINASFLPSSKFFSAGLGEVPVGITQRKHIHERSENGDEVMFIFEGQFELVTDTSSKSYDIKDLGPVYIAIKNGETAVIKNTGNVPVKFISFFTPPWEEGEIKWTEPLN
jgi:mannose-6-phosphate isomerase-like protein (cupin superfamily)